MITIGDFSKIELVVGQILSAEDVEGADKLYRLEVDLGSRKIQLAAGIKKFYTKEELKGKKIVVVANLEPAKIRGIESQGMLLAAMESKDKVVLVTVDKDVSPGSKIG